jgi:predicted nucleic acid-binding protein
MTRSVLVLDASVGVKWFKREAGSDEALALLEALGAGEIDLVVPAVFPHEVLDVARRVHGSDRAREAWERMDATGMVVAGVDSRLVADTLKTAARLGCTLYDAAAPALAARLGCTFVSADARAHRHVESVRLIG